MGHAAVTRADTHRFAQAFARGGIGQAGVDAKPFRAWIDAWEMRGLDPLNDDNIAPCELKASGADFSYALRLDAQRPLVLQGDGGYSRKSLREQASYYYSQPHYTAKGVLTIDDKPVDVTGQAWLDREWSSQPLASDQSGWDWLSLHFKRRRQADAVPDAPDRRPALRLGQMDRARRHGRNARLRRHRHDAAAVTEIEGRKIPTHGASRFRRWRCRSNARRSIARSWMGTSFPYWEGPISFAGSHTGLGYLEMTGY
jgi:predicted secreted hydrolase